MLVRDFEAKSHWPLRAADVLLQFCGREVNEVLFDDLHLLQSVRDEPQHLVRADVGDGF